MEEKIINNRDLYRLPWTLPDNAISWLEPTAQCNLACDGCYRKNEINSHKPIDEVKKELDVFQEKRNTDCISIAGGDPLLYPDILELVTDIKSRGWKPIINTNGLALTKELLVDLKKAGVFGFTFHVDSKQGRTGKWKDKNEVEMNELRSYYADMVYEIGGISCSFNMTVYEDTLGSVPEVLDWAHKNINKVQSIVFIAFRYIVPSMELDWFAGSKKVDWHEVMYHSEFDRQVDILSTDILKKAREKYPDMQPCAFLNGTKKSDSYKWLLTERIGTKKHVYGYVGAKFMEMVMTFNHLFTGTYLSYGTPFAASLARSAMLFLWPFDKGLRKSFLRLLKNPLRLFRKTYFQTALFIQPVDFMENGEQSMCDGCPDITVHEGELVWSCRLEERFRYGTFLRSVPKN